MGGFAIIVEFDLLEGSFDLFHQEVAKNAKASKAEEPGCWVFDILIPNKDENRITLYEVYDDEAAFQAHLLSPHFKDFSNRVSGLVTDRKLTKFRISDDA
jgi:autoinducer 2-degrading protein